MSRVGRSPIAVPSNVTVTLSGDTVNVKGPQGTLERQLPEGITIAPGGRHRSSSAAPTTSAGTAPCTASPARWWPTWSRA